MICDMYHIIHIEFGAKIYVFEYIKDAFFFFFFLSSTLRIYACVLYNIYLYGDSGILPLIFLKIGNMPLFANYIGACPCFDT